MYDIIHYIQFSPIQTKIVLFYHVALRVVYNLSLMTHPSEPATFVQQLPNVFVQRLPNVFQTSWTFGTRWVFFVQSSLVHV